MIDPKDSLGTKLAKIQVALHAPKDQTNTYGAYQYRSAESILAAVKPLLAEHGLVLVMSDEIKEISGRFYVTALVSVIIGEERLSTSASARESESRKGMDAAQITGAASSYARKYALSGLFAIDDSAADPDHGVPQIDKHGETISDANVLHLKRQIEETNTDPVAVCDHYQVDSLEELTLAQYTKILKQLAAKSRKHQLQAKDREKSK